MICQYCEKTFFVSKRRNQKHCSQNCRWDDRKGVRIIDGVTFQNCVRCGESKPLTDYPVFSKFRNGYHGQCKTCQTKWRLEKIATMPTKLCGCGCGEVVTHPPSLPYGKLRDFKQGHHARFRADRNAYVPTPEEIPNGLCECGCGKKTSIAKRTSKTKRHFQGHPVPFVTGHSQYTHATGENRPSWKGGRIKAFGGYIRVRLPKSHPSRKKYMFEHRFVIEKELGRELLPSENVHHINGIRDDNRIENLELWVKSQPCGQRREDIIAFCVENLKLYKPELLKSENGQS